MKRFIVNVKGKVVSADITSFVEDKLLYQDKANTKQARVEACKFIEGKETLPKYLQNKITAYCKMYGVTFGEVVGSIASNNIVASVFAKKAGRQSTAQKAQVEYIQNNHGISIKVLPNTGPESLRLFDGNLIFDTITNIKGIPHTKAIDGVYKKDLICLKWTNSFGGAQDNQANDVINFLENAILYTNNNKDDYRFVAIIDGLYYKKKWNFFSSYATDRIIVTDSDNYKKNINSKPKGMLMVG